MRANKSVSARRFNNKIVCREETYLNIKHASSLIRLYGFILVTTF